MIYVKLYFYDIFLKNDFYFKNYTSETPLLKESSVKCATACFEDTNCGQGWSYQQATMTCLFISDNVTSEEIAATTNDKIASTMFDFELDFDQWAVEEWVSHNWAWLCLVIGVAYVFLVFLGTNKGIFFESMKKMELTQERQ